MTPTSSRCTENTRLAGWVSALIATATFAYLQDAYTKLPLIVPISFESGNPDQFAFKSAGLVYLPFGLQIALGVIFAAIVAIVVGRREGAGTREQMASARQTAEGVALLAAVWIAFQAVNAWRLVELWRRTYDADIELYVLALITALTATVTVCARVVVQVQATESGPGRRLQQSVLGERGVIATAGLAAVVAVGIGAPLYLLSVVWSVLQPI